jgi:hypothetical protein
MYRIYIAFGVALVAAGIIARTYLSHYTGQLIQHTGLYTLLAYAAIGAGALIFVFGLRKQVAPQVAKLEERYNELVSKGEEIKIDFDHCDFHAHSYRERTEKSDYTLLFASESGYSTQYKYEDADYVRSYLVYKHDGRFGAEKFFSPAFPLEADVLRFRVLQGQVKLFVDRSDRSRYQFVLQQDGE